MTITLSLRFLYIFWGSGLLCAAAGRRAAAKPMQPELVPGLDDDDGLTRPGAKRVRLWRDRTPEGAFPPSCLLLLPTVVPND